MMTFHVLNGESTAQVFRTTEIPGEYLAWREDLSTGRVTDDNLISRESWINLRVEALTDAYALDAFECSRDLSAQEQWLEASLASDEVMLWFEYDMFCQINLVYLFDWYESHSKSLPRLTIPGILPLVERGLGTLGPSELTELFSERVTVSETLRREGHEIWRAYSSSDPSGLVNLLKLREYELPYLRRSLACHISRFPSVENGLNVVEDFALGLIANGKKDFAGLFRESWKSHGAYGFGDSQFFNELKHLVDCRTPLLSMRIPGENDLEDNAFVKSTFEITEAGMAVLERRADQIALNGIDSYLGGVHLTEGSCWRWDSNERILQVR